MMLLENRSSSPHSLILLFLAILDGFRFKGMYYSIDSNLNIFKLNADHHPFSVLPLLYHQFSISILSIPNFLQYVTIEDKVYDNLAFGFTLFGNSF
jgi:hypothetical protein